MKNMRHMKKWICILFVLAVTITGMCFEPVKADSSFCCIKSSESSEISYVSPVLEQNRDLCTGELLGASKPQSSIVARRSFKSRDYSAKLFTVQSIVAFLPKYAIHKTEVLSRYLCRNVRNSLQNIVCFIHHQDGSKG